MSGEGLRCASLSEAKISKYWTNKLPTNIQLAQQASQAQHPSSSKHRMSSMDLALAHVVPQHIHLSQLTSLWQSAHQKIFLVHFFLWSTNKFKVEQYMHVVSKESFLMCPFMCLL